MICDNPDARPSIRPVRAQCPAAARRGGALIFALALASLAAAFAKAAEPSAAQLARIPQALPSAPPLPSAIRKKIAWELASRPSDYEPRTRNLRPDGSPEYSNRLLLEASPYLQQHAHNPVNWYPWGDEAFEAMRRRLKPARAGEHRLFDLPLVPRHGGGERSMIRRRRPPYLNAHFIAIKVDREVRPDIDNCLHGGRAGLEPGVVAGPSTSS